MATTNIGVRVPEELKTQLQALARGTGRTMSFVVQSALEEYVQREAWQVEEIHRAIAEADAGDFATDDEVSAAFARWRPSD